MKITNTVKIELSMDEAIKLAKILSSNICEPEDFSFNLKEELCNQLDIKSWDL